MFLLALHVDCDSDNWITVNMDTKLQVKFGFTIMAVASNPAGPVLAGPVFTVIVGTAHVHIMNNE